MVKVKKHEIERVWITHEYDDCPDLSYLGEYTDRADDWAIDRTAGEYLAILRKPKPCEKCEGLGRVDSSGGDDGDFDECLECDGSGEVESDYELPERGRECRFFKPLAGGATDENFEKGDKYGATAEDYRKYGLQDFERMEDYERGGWQMLTIIARCKVRINGVQLELPCAALSGVESDSGEYLKEVHQELLAELRDELRKLGFNKRATDKAFENCRSLKPVLAWTEAGR